MYKEILNIKNQNGFSTLAEGKEHDSNLEVKVTVQINTLTPP
jgi:hypothetical protein